MKVKVQALHFPEASRCSTMYTAASSSCSVLFAGPMVLSERAFVKEYRNLEACGAIPDLNKKMHYKVYSYEGSGLCAHRSILLTANDDNFVAVDLSIEQLQKDGSKNVYPRAYAAKSPVKSKLKLQGVIETSGIYLMKTAFTTMKYFGAYCKLFNNCRSFCNSYLKGLEAIGFKSCK